MTIAELRAQIGATDDGLLRYHNDRGSYLITAWTGDVNGKRGWWWAMTRSCGSHEIIAAMGWSAGLRARDRDTAIAATIAGMTTGMPS